MTDETKARTRRCREHQYDDCSTCPPDPKAREDTFDDDKVRRRSELCRPASDPKARTPLDGRTYCTPCGEESSRCKCPPTKARTIYCPKCGSDEISVARNMRSTGTCGACGFTQDDAYRTFPTQPKARTSAEALCMWFGRQVYEMTGSEDKRWLDHPKDCVWCPEIHRYGQQEREAALREAAELVCHDFHEMNGSTRIADAIERLVEEPKP